MITDRKNSVILLLCLVCTPPHCCTLLMWYPYCIVFWIVDFVQLVLGVFVVTLLCFGSVFEPAVL